MARLTIRVDFGGDAAFGPGKARLLELIDEKGSLRRAAAAMKMSYRRAWLLLEETEAMMKAPVVAARTGGARGGGTALTPFGRALVTSYRAVEKRAARAAVSDLRSMSAMTIRVSRLASGHGSPRKSIARKRRQGSS